MKGLLQGAQLEGNERQQGIYTHGQYLFYWKTKSHNKRNQKEEYSTHTMESFQAIQHT